MKIGTIQSLGCVALGTMLGFIAATREFSPSSRADGPPPATRQSVAASGATVLHVEKPSCCSEGLTRDMLSTLR